MSLPQPLTVLLALPTFRRPGGLARLLEAVAHLEVPPGCRLHVRVFDNSPEGGALDFVERLARVYPVPLSALHVPERGLSSVRNAALEVGLGGGFDGLGFIDDDEAPEPAWLMAHLHALQNTGAHASQGAVHAAWTRPPPRWVEAGGFLEQRAGSGDLRGAATSNILFDLAPVRRQGLRFDPRYDLTGGEDTAFFADYLAAGGRIVFTPDAIVHETIPPERTRLPWLWRRWRRTGETSARVEMDHGRPRWRAIMDGVIRLVAGTALAVAALPLSLAGRPALWARGVRIAARGLGYLSAAGGRFTAEYAALGR